MDECAWEPRLCPQGQRCENLHGAHRCLPGCRPGFRLVADAMDCEGDTVSQGSQRGAGQLERSGDPWRAHKAGGKGQSGVLRGAGAGPVLPQAPCRRRRFEGLRCQVIPSVALPSSLRVACDGEKGHRKWGIGPDRAPLMVQALCSFSLLLPPVGSPAPLSPPLKTPRLSSFKPLLRL